MAFNLTKAQEKRLALLQRVNFEKLLLNSGLVFDLIQFPESFVLLGEIKHIENSKDGQETQDMVRSFGCLLRFAASQKGKCILCLPGLSPQGGFLYGSYPSIKVDAENLPSLLKSVNTKFEKFDYLALVSEDLKHGVVLDVYAGDPEIHGSDKEVCKITEW